MTPEQYIQELRRAIRSLPPKDEDEAVAYYQEYLGDADDPAAAMAALGTPKEVAAEILANYVGRQETRPGIGVLWGVVLGILAAPIAAPLAIAAFSVVLALVITVLSVVFSLLATTVGLAIGGIGMVVMGILVIGQDAATVAWLIGGGLVVAALGLLGTFGMIVAGRAIVTTLARWAASIIARFRKGKQS